MSGWEHTAAVEGYPIRGVDCADVAVHDARTPRVPSRRPPLDPEGERLAATLVRDHPLASAHEHLSVRPLDPADYRAYRREGREVLPHGAMGESGLRLVFDGGIASPVRARELWARDDVIDELGFRLTDLAHHDDFVVVRSGRDLDVLGYGGAIGVALTLESASCISGDLDRLDVLFGIGVRSLGLVYSESNRVGSGLAEARDAGLTRFGRDVVRRMNRVGMVVDVAHASELTALDVCEVAEAPVVVSHAGARSVLDIARNKSNEVIRAVAATGGIFAISASPYSTTSPAHPVHTIDSVMDHVEYCIELVGVEHVALGLDTHFGDHLAWHRAWTVHDPRPVPHPVEYVDGVENPAEGTLNVLRWMVGHGYGDHDIAAICGGNLMRVARACWPR